MKKFFKFLAGAFIGAAAGALVVTLLAPESGDEVRLAIKEKAKFLREQMQEAAKAKREELEAELERYKQAG
jgi:gas vesicle protein